jgi:hypothetical protein
LSNHDYVAVSTIPQHIVDLERGDCVVINNGHYRDIFIGWDAQVSTFNGLPLKPGSDFIIRRLATGKASLWGITDMGAAKVVWMRWKELV